MKKLLTVGSTLGVLALSASPALAALSIKANSEFVKITDLGTLISGILSIILIIAAIAAFLFLILGGLQWITSGGDKAQLEAARNKITSAIVGLIVVAAAFAIMVLVQQFLGIGNLFGGTIRIPTGFGSQSGS